MARLQREWEWGILGAFGRGDHFHYVFRTDAHHGASIFFDAGSFQAGEPHPWSPMAIPDHAGFSARSVTIAPDGKRFAVLMPAEQPLGNRVTFVMNFFDEVRRHAATR